MKAIHHLAFATNDMDETIRFWRDLLGLSLALTLEEGGHRQYFFALEEGQMISFFEWEGVQRPAYKQPGKPVGGVFHFDHIALAAACREELFQLQNHLAETHSPVSEVIDHGFCLSVYSYDPNHIPIEIAWGKPGIDLYRRPLWSDAHPSPLAEQGPHPLAVSVEVGLEAPPILPGVGSELF